jgi:hypothetical protein
MKRSNSLRYIIALGATSHRYIYSTPVGVGPSLALPQVAPGAIYIQPLSGLGASSAIKKSDFSKNGQS